MNFNLMYSKDHITMGTSNDDLLLGKNSKNPYCLHNIFNKFLVSPYLPRPYIGSLTDQKVKKQYNDNNKEIDLDCDDSLGETHIYYPKPNTYNSIYTQRFSKKYKNYYNNPLNYIENNNNNDKTYLYKNINMNNPIRINDQKLNYYKIRTPYYQIKKEIQFQKTPNKYNNNYKNINEIRLFYSPDITNKKNILCHDMYSSTL